MRVFAPADPGDLRSLLEQHLLPGPRWAFAVTAELRAELAGLDEEQLEYAVTTAAAESSYDTLAERGGQRGRRVVVVAEVEDTAIERHGEDAGSVRLRGGVPLDRVAAVLADPADVDISGPPEEDLAWYATQEIANLLA